MDINPSDSLDLQTSEGKKVMRLATVGLALNSEHLTRELDHHQPSRGGRVCVGCGQVWCCPLGRIALGARLILEMAREGVEPRAASVAWVWEEFGFFDDPADDDIVPPVIGLDEP